MKTLATALVVCLTAAMTLAQESPSPVSPRAGYASTSLAGDALEVRFIRWSDAILIEDVMVNGKGPYRFLLDTGAEGAGRVDRSLVEELELPETGSTNGVGLLGQELPMSRHRMDSLSIAGLTFSGVEMSSRDYNAEMTGPGLRPIHGILGYHLFSEYLLTINYPARTITIAKGELPTPDGTSILPIISDDEDPEIEVSLGDQTVQALIDTGAMGHLGVPDSLGPKLKFAGEPVVRGRQNGVELRSATLDGALRIGAIEFAKPDLIIAGRLNQVVVGIRILASLSVTFDQKNARVRVERPAERKRYGIRAAWRGAGPWEFSDVDAGSIAEAAGLRTTDRVITINGRPFAELNREDLFKLLDSSPLTLEIERDGKRLEIRMSLDS